MEAVITQERESVSQERSALDYFGGFEAYQQRLYETISKGLLKLTIEQLLYLERRSTGRVSGFDKGLVDFIKAPVYITDEMASRLETPLRFSQLSILGECVLKEDREYWMKRMKDQGAFSTGPELTPEFFISLEALEESKKLAKAKNATGEKPKFKLQK